MKWILAYLAVLMISSPGYFALEAGEDDLIKTVEAIAKESRPSLVTISRTSREGIHDGVGSGFVISGEGLIATNLHVIGEARPISVKLSDGRNLHVTEVYASDRKLDLAILRVDEEGLVPLVLSGAEEVADGVRVVALGNPQGLEHSVVEGVVSAVRDIDSIRMLQLAIPIEPGNSGGPLMNRKGEVIGIPTLKSAQTANLGFAMPVSALRLLLDKPNPVPMAKWLTVGRLNPGKWKPLQEGANWSQRAGRIKVEGMGDGFGGRALCLYQDDPPDSPYEVAVDVRLEDESGAAGLAFASDEGDRHFGFYPTNGQIRLTWFDGPSVFEWNILADIPTEAYRPGDWNRLRIRVDELGIKGFVNGVEVIAMDGASRPVGRVGLCKFRDTVAEFRRFAVGDDLRDGDERVDPAIAALVEAHIDEQLERPISQFSPDRFRGEEGLSRQLLESRARLLEDQAEALRSLSGALHRESVQQDFINEVNDKEDAEIDLFLAGLLIAKLEIADLPLIEYDEELDQIANDVAARFETGMSEWERIELLIEDLFHDRGFHGSRMDYYNRQNSYLSAVLDDREGIPVTLSVLFIELAERVGIDHVKGLPLPGHFVVQYLPENPDEHRIIDVFDGGNVIKGERIGDWVKDLLGLSVDEAMFRPAGKREILIRMIRNLVGIELSSEDAKRALPYLDLLLGIAPDEAPERLSRAILRYQSNDYLGALEDVDWLLEERPVDVSLERLDVLRVELEKLLQSE